MKVKRILTFILSLIMLFTCSVALAEEPEAEEPLESENELSVIMEDEIEIVQAEALLSAAPEEEQEDDPDLPDDEEDIIDEDESDPSEDEDLTEDEGIPDDEDDMVDEPETPIEEPAEEPADELIIPEEPTEDPVEEPGNENPDIPQDLTVIPSDIPLEEPVEEPVEKPTEEPIEESEEEPADKPEEELEPVEEPAEEDEKEPEEEPIEEPAEEEPAEEEPTEEEPEELPPHQAGDFVQVTKDTWVFTDMDKTEAANRIKSDLFVGVFVRDAVVQIDDVLRDANGDYWYKVRYLYGDELKSGALKWTAYGSVQEHKAVVPHGKQTVKQLVGQNAGVENVEIGDDINLRSFNRIARKYGVDYAVKKVEKDGKPQFLVFFKSRDKDAITSAMKEYIDHFIEHGREERPSIRKMITAFREMIKGMDKDRAVRREISR